MNTTVITALYDIERESLGDGRSMNDYFAWLNKTLTLNSLFVLFIQDKLFDDFNKTLNLDVNVSLKKRLFIKITSLEEVPYYKYKTQMDTILMSSEYKNIIKDPSRIECKLSMYNIIQYSKLEWIRQVIEDNPFDSTHFFWMDAGCSRFFDDIDIHNEWPNPNNYFMKNSYNKIIIQGRNDLHYYPYWNTLHLDSTNLLCGTMFGGDKNNMLWLADMIRNIFEQLLNIKIVNNEQIALAIIWKQFSEKFNIYINNTNIHLPLFKVLSYV